ncbi:aminotransferase class I/II-fold pyridoxal phosphate-dependent enzyme [Pedobacter sp. BS3]|uniref:trans-sulfuration enzyme family protein n=1 Tax=Pedobacter sp. BS3 TaxID=2567937 RepID=UPI0011EEF7B3|nr:aminotransferase class I/II-fold pyridoxal phosphate-dependent enzyme [Pedobacter sp. BS3]TZF84825.1 aminotransferase class I/II-fold pyridoxal phosphate-dependent enzyme [Pedobacter sp. BS3]
MNIETIAIHAGNIADHSTHAVVQPITLSTTFLRDETGSYPGGYMYTRIDNPNRKALEQVLTQLEGGTDTCCFASGNAAGNALFQALSPGDHIIAPADMYHGMRNLLKEVYTNSLQVDFADLSDVNNLLPLIRKETKLIWIETPSNPLLQITPIREITAIAQQHNIKVCCDNTFATPVLQNPLALGADIVMHSTTKYLSGHSDVLGGCLTTKNNDQLWQKIRRIQELSGSVPSPFDCYMTVRGIKTLPYRMRGHVANARALADFLYQHPKVEDVFYPGLPSHPGHAIAAAQMQDFGGMLSFTIKGTAADAARVASSTKLFAQATSLGGVESLIEHRASIEGPDTKTPKTLLRVSVGLENINDLINDISLAIN